eukprot:6927058-Prymnesium_polylepis.1
MRSASAHRAANMPRTRTNCAASAGWPLAPQAETAHAHTCTEMCAARTHGARSTAALPHPCVPAHEAPPAPPQAQRAPTTHSVGPNRAPALVKF